MSIDISKIGSASRKPYDEGAIKKEIESFLVQQEKAEKSHDFNASIDSIDFPVAMITDNSKGVVMAKEYSRDEYVAMMKPFFESMPNDMSTNYKPQITVLSDSLADVVNDYTVTIGQQSAEGRWSGLLVKKDGKWLWKTMIEAGWGDAG